MREDLAAAQKAVREVDAHFKEVIARMDCACTKVTQATHQYKQVVFIGQGEDGQVKPHAAQKRKQTLEYITKDCGTSPCSLKIRTEHKNAPAKAANKRSPGPTE